MKKILPKDIYISILQKETTEEQLWLGINPSRPGRKSSGCFFFDAFVDLMHEKLRHEPASVYAKHLDVETRHLHAIMYAFTGMSFVEWQRQYLLLMAKELLRDTDMSCLEIACFMHFGSNTAFSQWLVPLLGDYPSEWRKL